MIEDEMYGMMLRAKIDMRPSAPPENMSNMPRMPPALCEKISCRMPGSMPGDRDIGPEAIGDERAQGEPDAALELGRLREGPEIYAACELLGG